jgi:hypothetical protein
MTVTTSVSMAAVTPGTAAVPAEPADGHRPESNHAQDQAERINVHVSGKA